MRAVGRLFAATLGFMAAVIAAAVFLLSAKVGISPPAPEYEPWFWSQFFVYGGVTASMLGAMAFLPGVVLILVSEIFSIRSFLFHVGAGGLLGLAATFRLDRMHDRMSAGDVTFGADVTLLVAGGFVGGFVYWLIAGRMAGLKPLGPPPGEHGLGADRQKLGNDS
jgi:hypothetical protein